MHTLKLFLLSLVHPLDADAQERIDTLRRTIRSLPALPTPTESMSAGETIWIEFRRKLREALLTRDPRFFLQWDFIISSMFCGGFEVELEALRQSPEWSQWERGIQEPSFGHPTRFPSYPKSSGNFIHYAYSLHEALKRWGVRVSDFSSIVEFGGGYGGAALIYRQLGFTGSYVIYDLPEFSALQAYYLASVGCTPPITLVSDLPTLKREVSDTLDLLVGTLSLSESPIGLRDAIFATIPHPRHILIAYQNTLGRVDNVVYFKSLSERMPDYEWETVSITQLPGNEYLFGKQKTGN